MGYVLVVAVSIGPASPTVTNMYMAMYALPSIGVFGDCVDVWHLSVVGEAIYIITVAYFGGVVLTGVMTVMLLSMAGIPLTAGFITKIFAVLAAARDAGFLAVMIVVGSAIGLFTICRSCSPCLNVPKAHEIEFDALWRWEPKQAD